MVQRNGQAWRAGGSMESLEWRMLLSAAVNDATGVEHRVWREAGELVLYARSDEAAPQVVHAASGPLDGAPAVAVDQNLDVFVAWSEQVGDGAVIFLSSRLHGGQMWSAPIRITDGGAAGQLNRLVDLTTTSITDDSFGRSGRTVHFTYESTSGDGAVQTIDGQAQFIQPRAYADAPDLVFDQPVFGDIEATVPLVRMSDTAFRADSSVLAAGRHSFRYLGGAVNAIGEEARPVGSSDALYVGGIPGDFNSDGRIDGDDYFVMDRAQLEAEPLPQAVAAAAERETATFVPAILVAPIPASTAAASPFAAAATIADEAAAEIWDQPLT